MERGERLVRDVAARALALRATSVTKDASRLADGHPGPIHLLLTDMVMPEMSGPQLAQRIVAPRPDTAVLYMSGYTDNAPIGPRLSGSPVQFLQKPFSPADLARKVRVVLDSTRQPTPA